MKTIWIAVIVESGIPTEVKLFLNKNDALTFRDTIENKLNLEDDSIEIFMKRVNF